MPRGHYHSSVVPLFLFISRKELEKHRLEGKKARVDLKDHNGDKF